MATINKKLIHFSEKENFDTRNNAGDILDSSIVFVKDSNEIYTHNAAYKWIGWSKLISPEVVSYEASAGDVVCYDQKKNKITVVKKTFIASVDKNNYIPIGIVVIPGSHNVYGDGSCGVMSLKEMSWNTPESGSNAADPMYFGPQVDLSLFGYTKVVVYASDGSLATNNFGYLSKDGVYNYSSLHIPDPYLSDGSRNPDYHITSGITNANYNALSDFRGKSNTQVILEKRGSKDYSTWTLTNTTANYPAASACDMFHTVGTQQGDWYLPACGELGYAMAKWSEIQESVNTVNSIYGNVAVQLEEENGYWTSTENATKNARYVHMSNGVGYSNKDTNYSVRAFYKCNI